MSSAVHGLAAHPGERGEPYDLVGVGIGPMNLSLAALADGVDGLRALFLDENEQFSWHPGLLIDGAKLQVRFLGDLVSLLDPRSQWSITEYLRLRDRLYHFYFAERFYIPRREYDDYCRWVATSLRSCVFGRRVTSVRWDEVRGLFAVDHVDRHTGDRSTVHARNVVLGVGTRPSVPEAIAHLVGDPRVVHSADYLPHRDALRQAADVTVVGAGQSGAEVFLDLLRAQAGDGARPGGPGRLRWFARSPGFLPMEPSQLGQEYFTPDYSRYFQTLPSHRRHRIAAEQWRIHKAISMETLEEIFNALYERGIGGAPVPASLQPGVALVHAEAVGGTAGTAGTAGTGGADASLRLTFEDVEQGERFEVETSRVVLATGYRAPSVPEVIEPLVAAVRWDDQGRFEVGADNRVELSDPSVTGGLFVQHGETHAHGIIATDLSHSPYRGATILNSILGREHYRIPRHTAFATFGADAHRRAAGHDAGAQDHAPTHDATHDNKESVPA